ncbi:hypothetical protein [Aliikangiella sp. IMCC44359]|uniref:hypothetical protein n=1 Tax=Aliikangiella sp. IMCC44359 TaxID=3459125 RepID=UPI00403AD2BE
MNPIASLSKLTTIKVISIFVLSGVVLLFSCISSAKQKRTHEYNITIDKDLSKALVKICFDGKPPEYLVVDDHQANKNLVQFPEANQGYIEFQGRYWRTNSLHDNACLHYQSDISEHNHKHKYKNKSKLHAALSFQSDNTWLWIPEELSEDEDVRVTFHLPQNYRVSAPWKLLDKQGRQYMLGKTPHDWGMTIMIGDFNLETIQLKQGGQLNVALLSQLNQKKELLQWVENKAESLASYLGKFPLQQIQVILIENNRFKKGPVPWGDVKRGGGFGIRFVVDSQKPIEEFYSDWTATHEFGHLLLPKIEYQDIWLSEGLASYLQYVLMAQSGQISQQQVWQKLYKGFKRGLKGTSIVDKETLIEATENRRKGKSHGRTKRIYWSGAAYFLIADYQLYKNSNGKQGLSQVLKKLNECCSNSREEWKGKLLAAKLDELSNTKIFSKLYTQMAYSTSFPDFMETMTQLGIDVNNGEVTLLKNADYEYRDLMIPTN